MSFLSFLSKASMPIIILFIIVWGVFSKKKVYDCFLSGVSEGITTVFKIFPSLLALTVAVNVFRMSGALDFFISFITPLLNLINVPPEVVPLILIRPLSGSGALATLSDIMTQHGVDTPIGQLACIIMGSTETILYTLTIYFGCINIQKTKYTFFPAIIADIFGVFIAIVLVNRFFN